MELQPSASSTNAPLKLNDLHDEFFHFYLFKCLNLDDILELKRVSKAFYSIVNNYELNQLSFLDDAFYDNCTDNWLSTTEPIQTRNQVSSTKLGLLKNAGNLLNLKYLRIKCLPYASLKLRFNDLNKFKGLEILEVCGIFTYIDDMIQLPELRALSIDVDVRANASLIINASNLLTLHVSDQSLHLIGNHIKFNQPGSIRFLKLHSYAKNASVFDNLVCLEFYGLPAIAPGNLKKLKELKKLKLNHQRSDCKSDERNKLKSLLRSKKHELEIFLSGVRVNAVKDFDDARSDLEFQLSNFEELEDDLDFMIEVKYNDLVRLKPNPPANLFEKYTNIQEIRIQSSIEDENRLVQFIKRCPNLSYLTIYRSSLNQQFFDQLPAISTLSHLSTLEKNINLRFILKMTYIIGFEVGLNDALDEDFNLNDLKYLKKFSFAIHNFIISVRKTGKDCYIVGNHKSFGLPDERFNLKDLIVSINYLRDKHWKIM